MTMNMQPVVYSPELAAILVKLDEIQLNMDIMAESISDLRGLATLTVQGEARIMTDLSALTAEVQENSDAVDSAATLLSSLSQQIRDLSTDPAALQALADELDANTDRLAAAVTDNTPAAGGDTGDTGEPVVTPADELPSEPIG